MMLGKGRKVKDFIKRTLLDAGAIYDEPLDNQNQDSDNRPSLPMPNMLVDGTLVVGEDKDEDQNINVFGLGDDSSEDEDD
jgi:hypothetical protein